MLSGSNFSIQLVEVSTTRGQPEADAN